MPITVNDVRAEKVGEEGEPADGFHRGMIALAIPDDGKPAFVNLFETWFEEGGRLRIIVSLTYQVPVGPGLWEEKEVLLKRVIEVEESPRGESGRDDKGYYSDDVSPMTRSPVSR